MLVLAALITVPSIPVTASATAAGLGGWGRGRRTTQQCHLSSGTAPHSPILPASRPTAAAHITPPTQTKPALTLHPRAPHQDPGPSAHTPSSCAHHCAKSTSFASSGPRFPSSALPLPAPSHRDPGPAEPRSPDGPHGPESRNEAVTSAPPALLSASVQIRPGFQTQGSPCPLPVLAVSSDDDTPLCTRPSHGPPPGTELQT